MVELRHTDLTERIIRCAIDVHKALGPGLPLEYYSKALAVEMDRSAVPYLTDVPCRVVYQGVSLGERRIPLLIEDTVVVIPSQSDIDEARLAEGVALLRAANKTVGLILNFTRARLEIRRIAN